MPNSFDDAKPGLSAELMTRILQAPFQSLLVGAVRSTAIALPSEVALMHFPELGRVLAVGLMETVKPPATPKLFPGAALKERPKAPRFFYLPSTDKDYLYTYERDIPTGATLADVNSFTHLYAALAKSATIPIEPAYNCDETRTIETNLTKRVARLRESCSKL